MDSTRPLILQFLLDPRFGGPHQRIKTVAAKLPDFETRIVTCGQGEVTDFAIANLRGLHKGLYGAEVALNAALIPLKLARVCRERLVVFHVNGPLNIAPLVAARVLDVPVVWHFNDTYAMLPVLTRVGFKLLEGGRWQPAATTPDVARVYGLQGATVLFAPIDMDFWSRGNARGQGEFFSPGTTLKVAMVANLNPVKAHDVVLDALGMLEAGIEVAVIGAELETQRAYSRLLHAHPFASRMRFLGKQPRETVRELLAACDVFIMPSRSESQSLSLAEAMAMGCLCISSDFIGVENFIPSDEALVVQRENPIALAQALLQVAAMPEAVRQGYRHRAREKARERYSVDSAAQAHRQMYSALLRH